MKALCFVLVGLLLLVPLAPELFGMDLSDVTVLKNSENINQIEETITTGVNTIGTSIEVFGVVAGVFEFISTWHFELFRIVDTIVKGWIT